MKRRARAKAKGEQSLDEWRADKVAALPLALFEEFARFFEAIERGGAMCRSEVILAPSIEKPCGPPHLRVDGGGEEGVE